MLIKREVFERLKERFPELWCSIAAQAQIYLGLSEGVLQCFSSFQDSKGMFMGEDVALCRQWSTAAGGEIWACRRGDARWAFCLHWVFRRPFKTTPDLLTGYCGHMFRLDCLY